MTAENKKKCLHSVFNVSDRKREPWRGKKRRKLFNHNSFFYFVPVTLSTFLVLEGDEGWDGCRFLPLLTDVAAVLSRTVDNGRVYNVFFCRLDSDPHPSTVRWTVLYFFIFLKRVFFSLLFERLRFSLCVWFDAVLTDTDGIRKKKRKFFIKTNRLDVSAFKYNDDETREVGEKKWKKIATSLRREKKDFFTTERDVETSFFSSKTPRYVYGKYVPTLNRPEKNSAVSTKPCSHDSAIKNKGNKAKGGRGGKKRRI